FSPLRYANADNWMIELRPYQTDDAEALRQVYLSKKRAPLYVLPTGGGKTVVVAYIIAATVARGNRVLMVAHRRELITQASRKLRENGVKHAVCMPGHGACARDTVVVGSVQTVVRRLPQLGLFRLIVVDEGHHATSASYRTILAAQPQAQLL